MSALDRSTHVRKYPLSRFLWMLAGFVNLICGVAVLIECGSVLWGFRVPADFLFAAVAPVALVNIVLAVWNSRFRVPALLLNAFCGISLGLFAAYQFESFFAWVVTSLVCIVPSVVAMALQAQRR